MSPLLALSGHAFLHCKWRRAGAAPRCAGYVRHLPVITLEESHNAYSVNTDRCRARGGSFPRFIERWLNNVLAPRATAGHYRRQRGLLY
jgi:hypothetical protein